MYLYHLIMQPRSCLLRSSLPHDSGKPMMGREMVTVELPLVVFVINALRCLMIHQDKIRICMRSISPELLDLLNTTSTSLDPPRTCLPSSYVGHSTGASPAWHLLALPPYYVVLLH
jgi:hypothetical protein